MTPKAIGTAGVRSQADVGLLFQEWSDESATVCPAEEDRTRQEFASDCDVNVILRRYAAGGFEPRPVVYGVQDTDLDLDGVYAAAREAEAAWQRLPASLRRRYPGWPEVLAAVERGEAVLADSDGVVVAEAPKAEAVPPVSG